MIGDLAGALIRLDADLRSLGARWALIGGLAFNLRAEPRTTRDLDVAVAVADDREAEGLALGLRLRGYGDNPVQPWFEHGESRRLATVRMVSPPREGRGLDVDLMFASSGVETEIVQAAETLEVFPRFYLPVVLAGDLLALKVLAGRPKDEEDARVLLRALTLAELQRARDILQLIDRRGYHRGKDLLLELAKLQSE